MVVGEFTQETELVVIGGGPGGYSTAFRAAELGVEVVIVDREPTLGGICLHRGCVPSKTLLHIAEIIREAERASQFGVQFNRPEIKLDAVRAWVEKAKNQLARGLTALAKRHNVEVLKGTAVFEDSRRLAIADGSVPRIRFRRAVIATGSGPLAHEHLPFDHPCIWCPSDALDVPFIPGRLLIVGDTYMAVEAATVYSAFGSRVTMLTDKDRWLGEYDEDLTRPLCRQFQAVVEDICPATEIAAADLKENSITITTTGESQPKEKTFDAVIIAIGQRANVSSLRLERTSAQVSDRGFVQVDQQLRTTDARIYAVGDVTGGPLLADYALAQGRTLGEILAGWNSHLDVLSVPVVVFSDPQLAWCGLTELRAKAEGVPHAVIKVPWGASGRAVGMGRAEGMTKLIYDPDTKIVLGVGLVGPHAAEMISEGALAVEMGAELDDLAGTIHPHPTISELLSDAAKQGASRDEGK